MENWLSRTELLIGKNSLTKLKNSKIIIFGCGGVGSFTIEALVRAGIENIIIVDKDTIDITNLNRQLMTDTTVIGKLKVDVEKERLLKINPNLKITTYPIFANSSNIPKLLTSDLDYIVDAIDSVSSKIDLIAEAKNKNIPIISSMGTGNKLNPSKFEFSDIYKTSVCPLAKIIRKELRKRNISSLKVLYSKEEPKKPTTNDCTSPASISFMPSIAGLLIASEVINDLLDFKF